MTQEEKQLLLIDLCERLPYGVICRKDCKTVDNEDFYLDKYPNPIELAKYLTIDDMDITIKPYLRPMSSMTKEEEKEFEELFIGYSISRDRNCVYHSTRGDLNIGIIDWLNRKMFDHRGLIPMGLALEAPADMYHNTNLDVVDTVDDIMYDIDSDNIEVIYKSGKKTLHNIESLKLISSDERELGTEHDYLIEPNIHVVFYPEGHLSTFYFDE